MKRHFVLVVLLSLSCKKLPPDPEFQDFKVSVQVDNKGSNAVTVTVGARGGNFNKCKKSEDQTDTVVPPGTKGTYAMALRCMDPPAQSFAHFAIQKTLSDKAKAMKVAYAEFGNLKAPLTAGVNVAWRFNLVVTKAQTSADPWIAYQGRVEIPDLPVSLARPDVEGMQRSPVRILGKKVAVFVDVPDVNASVDIGLPKDLFPDGTAVSDDGFVYTQAQVNPIADYDGFAYRVADYPVQIVCDSDQCTISLVN